MISTGCCWPAIVMPLASTLRASPSTHWSASPNAAMGPVCGLTMPILTVRPAARPGLANSVGAASALAVPAPRALMTLRRDGFFGLLAISHFPRRLLIEFYRDGIGAGNRGE